MSEREAWAVLTCVDGLGPVGMAALLGRYGSGLAILQEASRPGGAHRLAAPTTEDGVDGETSSRRPVFPSVAAAIVAAAQRAPLTLERIRALGLHVVTVADSTYPARLAAIAMPPHVLFVLGDRPRSNRAPRSPSSARDEPPTPGEPSPRDSRPPSCRSARPWSRASPPGSTGRHMRRRSTPAAPRSP